MSKTPNAPLSFISANSKNGFFSLYDTVFDTKKFDRIYLLAGGPGTGKSTFLRTVSQKAAEAGVEREEILCSSDPDSLDGVILVHHGKRIGVIDATPPHGRIITSPAICEELIDLGSFWNAKALSRHKEALLSLGEKKKEAYLCGYAYLRALGALWDAGSIPLLPRFDEEKAKRQIKHKLATHKEKGEEKIRLLHAFTGAGEVVLPFSGFEAQNLLFVGGNPNAAEIYLTYFNKIAKAMGIKQTVFLSPLDGESVEAIHLPESGTLLVKEGLKGASDKGRRIVADRFFSSLNDEGKERFSVMSTVKKMALSAFKEAKSIHAAIEEYYIKAMNFDALAEYRLKKADEILDRLLS